MQSFFIRIENTNQTADAHTNLGFHWEYMLEGTFSHIAAYINEVTQKRPVIHHELSDDTPRSGVVAATSQDGGQDVDGDKHRQISHGLDSVQRVGVGSSNQLTLTNRVFERAMAG